MFQKKIAILIIAGALFNYNSHCQSVRAVLPTPWQVKWANAEMGVIIHLDINIYAPDSFDYKRKNTLPDIDVFNPSKLNTDQWIRTAKAAGAKYALLTVKHGTGFALWPSKVNNYNVGHTRWRRGKDDILHDFITSCKKYGLKPGLYYNTNTNTYYEAGNKPFLSDSVHAAYNRAVLQQLTEIWSNYGQMFEIWFDGGISNDPQNGIEKQVLKLIGSRQPHSILFQGPLTAKNTIRWVGNEDGTAAYPQWSRANATTASNGIAKIEGLHGNRDGNYWCPAESDFPIRRNNAWNGGWLWKAGQDSYLFTVAQLTDKYYKSVGRNTNMLVGMVVDTSGLIPRADSLVFDSLGKRIQHLFAKPIAKITNQRQRVIEINLGAPKPVKQVIIMEDIAKGECIGNYSIEAFTGNRWKEIANGESVGHKRIQEAATVVTRKLRLKVKASSGPVFIKQIAFY